MGALLRFGFAVATCLLFFAEFLYLVGFVGNLFRSAAEITGVPAQRYGSVRHRLGKTRHGGD